MSEIPIAYLGPVGSYSQQAMEAFGRINNIPFLGIPASGWEDVFKTTLNETELGIIAVENTSGGPVTEPLDLIVKHDMGVVGVHYLPVRHFLMGYQNDSLSLEGKVVHSHPQAIAQSTKFIQQNGLLTKFEKSTTEGVQFVAELPEEEKYDHLAIAGEHAADVYGLDILAENIQNNRNNTTRFLFIRPPGVETVLDDRKASNGMYKATIVYSVSPRFLHRVLTLVDEAHYRTDNIMPRPIVEDETDRMFPRIHYSTIGVTGQYIKRFSDLLDRIREEFGENSVKLLGLYPQGSVSE